MRTRAQLQTSPEQGRLSLVFPWFSLFLPVLPFPVAPLFDFRLCSSPFGFALFSSTYDTNSAPFCFALAWSRFSLLLLLIYRPNCSLIFMFVLFFEPPLFISLLKSRSVVSFLPSSLFYPWSLVFVFPAIFSMTLHSAANYAGDITSDNT